MNYEVLLIDDELIVATYLEALIDSRSRSEIKLHHVYTLGAGLAMLASKTHGYDLVILDLNLDDAKELYGLETILTRFPDATVMVLTGHYEEEQARKALEIGAQGYYAKPIENYEKLYKDITQAVARSKNVLSYKRELIETKEEIKVLRDENAKLKEEITQQKIIIANLEDKAMTRKISVDKQFKNINKREAAISGVSIMALLSNEKVLDLIWKMFEMVGKGLMWVF